MKIALKIPWKINRLYFYTIELEIDDVLKCV